jgi:hypothetical protein
MLSVFEKSRTFLCLTRIKLVTAKRPFQFDYEISNKRKKEVDGGDIQTLGRSSTSSKNEQLETHK